LMTRGRRGPKTADDLAGAGGRGSSTGPSSDEVVSRARARRNGAMSTAAHYAASRALAAENPAAGQTARLHTPENQDELEAG
jgi:hypothetical protein